MELEDALRKFNLELEILIVGVDSNGAHVHRVGNPGIGTPYNALGFCCIGSGERHADTVFAYRRYTPSFSLCRALYFAYEAKKKAEMAGGVGKTTDIAIVDEKGIRYLPDEVLEQLEGIYSQMETAGRYGELFSTIDNLQLSAGLRGE